MRHYCGRMFRYGSKSMPCNGPQTIPKPNRKSAKEPTFILQANKYMSAHFPVLVHSLRYIQLFIWMQISSPLATESNMYVNMLSARKLYAY